MMREPAALPGACRSNEGGHAMARDPRYDVLFEPVRIGPVTAKNRFYQVQTTAQPPSALTPRMAAVARGIRWPMPAQWGTW